MIIHYCYSNMRYRCSWQMHITADYWRSYKVRVILGDFSSVFTWRTSCSRTFPNGNSFISYYETVTYIYYKKILIHGEAGTSLIEPKHHFVHPASWNTTHSCKRSAWRTPGCPHDKLQMARPNAPSRPAAVPAELRSQKSDRLQAVQPSHRDKHPRTALKRQKKLKGGYNA